MTDEHPTHRFLCSTSPGVEDPDDPPVVTPATPTFSSGLVTSRATFPSLPRHRRRTRRSTTLTAPPLPPPPPRYDSRLPTGTTTIGNHHYRYDHHYHCHSPPRVAGTAARLDTDNQFANAELRGIFFRSIIRCRAIKPRKNSLHHPIRTSYDRVALSTVGSDGHYSR